MADGIAVMERQFSGDGAVIARRGGKHILSL